MSAAGVITLQPETGAEAYALRHWVNNNLVLQDDVMRNESAHWRGSGLLVNAEPPPAVFNVPPMEDGGLPRG
jgi:hypothetical protein